MSDLNIDNIGPLEANSAIKRMRDDLGWKIFHQRVSDIGDRIMGKLLSLTLDNGDKHTQRDLYAYQMDLLSQIANIPIEIEEEAKVYLSEKSIKGEK